MTTKYAVEHSLIVVAREIRTDADKEEWHYEVDIGLDDENVDKETINVQMNIDTIVCTLDGYGFKTFPWYSGDVQLNAVIAAAKYLQWCNNQ